MIRSFSVWFFILFYFTSNYIVLPRFTIWFHSELKFRECLVLYYLIFTKYFILFYFTVLDLFLGLVLFRHFFIFILFFFCVLSGSEFNFRVWIVFIFILFFRYVFYWRFDVPVLFVSGTYLVRLYFTWPLGSRRGE